MSDERGTNPADLGALEELGALFHDNRLPMWVHDGPSLRLLAANRATRAVYHWDDETIARMTIDDVKPRGIVSAQEFRSDDGPVWVVTELDGSEREQEEADHGRLLGELIEAQEQLRGAIAERLHDGPIQTLTALSLRLGLLKRAVDPMVEAKVVEAERLVVDALGSLRGEMNRNRGHGEVSADLRGALSSTVRWFGLDGRYDVETFGDEPSGSVGALLYRAAQDLLASSRGVSPDDGTRTVQVHVSKVTARLTIPVAHGVELAERLTAWVVALGGGVEYVEQKDSTTVVVTIPAGP